MLFFLEDIHLLLLVISFLSLTLTEKSKLNIFPRMKIYKEKKWRRLVDYIRNDATIINLSEIYYDVNAF